MSDPGVQHRDSDRLLVVMPSWVGDTVMATPLLRALRKLYPSAQITCLARSVVRPILDASPWIDRIVTVRPIRKGSRRKGVFSLARHLAARKFDTAVMLPNSFRSAVTVMLAGIPRRVGYDRDGRGFLLTDRLVPRRRRGAFVPVSTRDYYLGLVRYLGAVEVDPGMELFTRPEHDRIVDQMLKSEGWRGASQPLVVITPGAAYGEAKLWDPRRFAQIADRCEHEHEALVAIGGPPKERPILERVIAAAQRPILNLTDRGVDLTLFKSVVKRSRLVITNDTGPRHIAAALNVPVVSIFGPTDPAWTEIEFADERQVMVKVPCGPCQLKTCPLDHRCMTQIDSAMVYERVTEILAPGPPGTRAPVAKQPTSISL